LSSAVQTLVLPTAKRRRRRRARQRPAFDDQPTATFGIGDLDDLLSSLEAAAGTDDDLPVVTPEPSPPALPGLPPGARAAARGPARLPGLPPALPRTGLEIPSIAPSPKKRPAHPSQLPLARAAELRPMPAPPATGDRTLQTLENLSAVAPRSDAAAAVASAVISRRPRVRGALLAGLALAAAIVFGWLVAALASFAAIDAYGRAGVLLALTSMSPAASWIAAAVTRRCGGGRRSAAAAAVLGGLLGLAAAWAARAALPALADAMPVPAASLPGTIVEAARNGFAARDVLFQPGLIAGWVAEVALCLAAIALAARPVRRRAR